MPSTVVLTYNLNTQKTEEKELSLKFEDSLGHTMRPYLKHRMKT